MKNINLNGAHLFVPGNNAGFITKLPIINVDSIILDLEFATKYPQKNEGRSLVTKAIPYLRDQMPNLYITVRINTPYSHDIFLEDIKSIVSQKPDAIRIPSVTNADEVKLIDETISKLEEFNNIEHGTIKLHPMIENPIGLANAHKIASLTTRVTSLCLGGEDWAANLNQRRTKRGHELEYIKNKIVTIANTYNIIPIDSVYNFLDDEEGLTKDCQYSRQIGFAGRATVNPKQLKSINDIYLPTKAEYENALLKTRNIIKKNGMLISNGVIMDPVAINHYKRNIYNYELRNK